MKPYINILLFTFFLFSCSEKNLVEDEELIELSEIGILTNSFEFESAQTKSETTEKAENDYINEHFLQSRFIDRAGKYTLYVSYKDFKKVEYVFDRTTGKWKPKEVGIRYANDGKAVFDLSLEFTSYPQEEDILFSLDSFIGAAKLDKLSYTIDHVVLTHAKQLVVLSLPIEMYFSMVDNKDIGYKLIEDETAINSSKKFYTEDITIDAIRKRLYYSFIPFNATLLDFTIYYDNINWGDNKPETVDLSYNYSVLDKLEANKFLLFKGEFFNENRFVYSTVSNLKTNDTNYYTFIKDSVVYDF